LLAAHTLATLSAQKKKKRFVIKSGYLKVNFRFKTGLEIIFRVSVIPDYCYCCYRSKH